MNTIKIQNRLLLKADGALSFLEQREIPEPIGYRVARSQDSVNRAATKLRKHSDKLSAQYADKGPDGKPIVLELAPGVERFKITEREEEYQAEYERLMDEETEIRSFVFSLADFDFTTGKDADGKPLKFRVPPAVWNGLGPLLKENLEEDVPAAPAAP